MITLFILINQLENNKEKNIKQNKGKQNIKHEENMTAAYRIEKGGTIKYNFKTGRNADRHFKYREGRISTAIINDLEIDGYEWKRQNY